MRRVLSSSKELAPTDTYAQLEKAANSILSTLGVEKDGKTHIAYGTIVKELKEVSRSYKEAKMALDVGKIFFGDRDVIAYSSLGIGRLIYQLPIPLCKMFIREIFDNHSPDDFDEETLTTINKFFENSLNVSETSRQFLYTEILWCTDWINSRRAPGLICASLKMPLPLKLP